MYIFDEHIVRWVTTGKARIVPSDISAKLGDFLNDLPWLLGGGLDWKSLSGRHFDLEALSRNPRPVEFFETSLSADPFWIFWYAPSQPCIACAADFAISKIDEAFWRAPGRRFVFGASSEDDVIFPIKSHFAEYDGAARLMATITA